MNNTARAVLCAIGLQRPTGAFFKFENVILFTVGRNVICAQKKSSAFPAPISTKLQNAKEYHVWIAYTGFHTNRKKM